MEATIWQTLINQAPGTAAVIIVVWVFLKAIEKRDAMVERRDALFVEQVKLLTEELKRVKEIVIEHDVRVTEGMEAMYREHAKRKRSKKAE